MPVRVRGGVWETGPKMKASFPPSRIEPGKIAWAQAVDGEPQTRDHSLGEDLPDLQGVKAPHKGLF